MEQGRLSILGLGLLGASLGLAMKQAAKGVRITGYAHRRSTLDAAIARGVVDEGFDEPAKAVAEADVVVLCTPVGNFPELLERIGPALKAGAVVTDVGSTKRSVVQAAEKLLPGSVQFVGSHPMAGSEKRGVEHAYPELYRGALCIVTPTIATKTSAVEMVESLWRTVGMRTTRISPEDHDRLLAAVSHLPHAIAAALVLSQPDGATPLCGKGFLDSTRIAAGDPGLWRDIFVDNADNLRVSLARMKEEIAKLEKMVDARDVAAIEQWLAHAAQERREMNR